MAHYLSIFLLLAAVLVLMGGFPVAFTLGGVGILFALFGAQLGQFDLALLSGTPSRIYGIMINETLVAVPLFVLMGVILQRSRIAEDLLVTLGQMLQRFPGGLGVSVIFVGALLAASTGIVGATVVTMGLLSVPAMLRAGYDPRLVSGIVCSSGTLGQIIPPSIVLIFIADILQSANSTAQLSLGNYSATPVSVGALFMGALLPGLLLVAFYMITVIGIALFRPSACPAVPQNKKIESSMLLRAGYYLLPPILLIIAVLGSILLGFATPTEAASVGAIGAFVLAFSKQRLSVSDIFEAVKNTMFVSAMVFTILIGATVFSLVFRGLGGEELLETLLLSLPGGLVGAVVFIMALMFIMGFFLDTFEVVFLVIPIAGPTLLKLGLDPIWFGVAIGINLQTSFLTPPFGFALFYLRGAAGTLLTIRNIYAGVVPFVAIQLLVLLLVSVAPGIATWLPERVFNTAPLIANPAEEKYGPSDDGDTYSTY
ncbi:C4-dicarboxylate ABC transporter [Notoacmeibacter marinus]|uniref:TRAP transporter large permease protein n=1 Tax=Notoacmeibacter marinus TaxID=1876515 RepID=A0A231V1Y7_9HYPH|nr:TRAP transporter large permease subunit [Notoacmeibacter marinus]OXT02203.1 C4-dicarboxylate ABC transporter [Notoacmeibacter marinus]